MTLTGDTTASGAPDPSDVYDVHELRSALDRLRQRGAGADPVAAVGFTDLSRRTGMPRSTVHSYLVGPAVPGAAALDRIVLALGCSGRQARSWAEAWERASEADRGGPHSAHASQSPELGRLVHLIQAQLGHGDPIAEPVVRPVTISERCVVGGEGLIDRIDVRISARATKDGADRWYMRIPVGDSSPHPDLIEASSIHECEIARCRFVADPGFQAIEVFLGGPLLEGQVHTFEFRVHLARARDRARELGRTLPAVRADSASRAFPQQGPHYQLAVAFAELRPAQIFQIYQRGPTAPRERGQALTLNAWSSVSVNVERPAPGLHGIGWEW